MSFLSGDPSPTPNPNSNVSRLTELGWSNRWEPYVAEHDGAPGRVLRHDGHAVLVGTEHGSVHVALRPSTPKLAVGDWIVTANDVVVDLLPRASLLQRRDPSTGSSQPIAANVDIVGIVCGLDRPVSTGRVQRFTTLAWDAGATPLVILSKADLVESTRAAESDLLAHDPALDIVVVSSTSAEGVLDLLERCSDKTLVLVGESGAGKSTLLNALAGQELNDTGDVRGGDHKGRHTTTQPEVSRSHSRQGTPEVDDRATPSERC